MLHIACTWSDTVAHALSFTHRRTRTAHSLKRIFIHNIVYEPQSVWLVLCNFVIHFVAARSPRTACSVVHSFIIEIEVLGSPINMKMPSKNVHIHRKICWETYVFVWVCAENCIFESKHENLSIWTAFKRQTPRKPKAYLIWIINALAVQPLWLKRIGTNSGPGGFTLNCQCNEWTPLINISNFNQWRSYYFNTFASFHAISNVGVWPRFRPTDIVSRLLTLLLFIVFF